MPLLVIGCLCGYGTAGISLLLGAPVAFAAVALVGGGMLGSGAAGLIGGLFQDHGGPEPLTEAMARELNLR